MAEYDGERDIPDWWDSTERDLFGDLLGGEPELEEDNTLQMLFHEAMFDMDLDAASRAYVYDELMDYLWDEYGIDFELDFDWEAYREWYESG